MTVKWTELIELNSSGVARIKEVSGIYRLIYFDPERQNYYVYYIGQTDNLNDRLSQHLHGKEKDSCCSGYLDKYSCFVRVAAVSTQSDRDGAEVSLYQHFNPICVERVPDVSPLVINFT